MKTADNEEDQHMTQTSETKAYHTCPICEATCGLEFTLKDGQITRIRGDKKDVFSKGYFCPKGAALSDLHNDPDRLRTPVVRKGNKWEKVSWDEAFKAVEKGLAPLIKNEGPDAVAIYLGNPAGHYMAVTTYMKLVLKSLKTRNFFVSSTVDQMPKHVSCGLMFGRPLSIPIPDIDRTDYFLMLGANPMASNGSLFTAPGFADRIKTLHKRGGKLVVIDPCRTRTARLSDEHHFIRPGTDALFLFSLVQVLFEENRVSLGRLEEHVNKIAAVKKAARPFTPESVENRCGIKAHTIRSIARDLSRAGKAVVYGRMGTSVVQFGTLANWLVDLLNILTGNLDREGGAMFPMPAHVPAPGKGCGKGFKTGRWKSRVMGYPETMSELPAATLPDEIETPGRGQVKALVNIAANPVISNPDSSRLDKALSTLDFMVAVDFYINETNRHAHVILPPASPLSHSHYDLIFTGFSVRNTANYSAPVIPRAKDEADLGHILIKLAAIFSGMGADADPGTLDDLVIQTLVGTAAGSDRSPIAGRSVEEILEQLGENRGTERILDFLVRTGPYGDRFDPGTQGLSLDKLKASPHGIDLGPLKPRIPEILATPSGKIELAPEKILSDLARLESFLQAPASDQLLLISRRHLRCKNSWLHNIPRLVKGKNRCTLKINPEDASRLGLETGSQALVSTQTGKIEIPVEICRDIMKGVVSIPHGWGHNLAGTGLRVAATLPGVNTNILADGKKMDKLSGNAVLNGIPVSVSGI